MVCQWFDLKTGGDGFSRFDLKTGRLDKTTRTDFLGLASKSVVTGSPSLASKQVAQVS
jgi:hypothetical protein